MLNAGTVIRSSEGTRYEIVRRLSHGGMAEVWLARRLSAADFTRDVALKCISPGVGVADRVRRRRLAEAQLAGRLSHSNIVHAFALERIGDQDYLVLEYVDGASLAEVLDAAQRAGKRLSEGFCCHVAASVAEALDYVHAVAGADGRPLGIVHRDVKAANIMVASSGAVKLLDFGVAYSRMEGRDRTRNGTVKGTWGYFSPEQAAADREKEIDGRSDLFSLGVVLVELLTGERPFEAGNELTTIRRIADCAVADVERATEGVTDGLRELCRKALAKDRAQRFQSGGELAAALRTHLVEEGVPFFTAECAAELRELELAGARREQDATATVTGRWSAESKWEDEGGALPEPAASPRRRAGRPLALVVLAVIGLAIAAGALLERRRAHANVELGPAPAVATSAAGRSGADEPGGRCEMEPARVALASLSSSVGGLFPGDPVVRPKKSRAAVRGPSEREAGKGPGQTRTTATSEADGGNTATAVSTLARGTLIPAKLVAAIDAARPGAVEAVVAEDVTSGGSTLVPKGSALRCGSRRGHAGRVELSCGGVRTTKGEFAFSGVAVEGGRVGLRAVDGTVVPGTSFLVYVSASSSW